VLRFDRARRPLQDSREASLLAGAILFPVSFLLVQISWVLAQIWLLGARLGVSRGFRLCFSKFGG
jgi:hypothetical protein